MNHMSGVSSFISADVHLHTVAPAIFFLTQCNWGIKHAFIAYYMSTLFKGWGDGAERREEKMALCQTQANTYLQHHF